MYFHYAHPGLSQVPHKECTILTLGNQNFLLTKSVLYSQHCVKYSLGKSQFLHKEFIVFFLIG
jgi:hypothetical protein